VGVSQCHQHEISVYEIGNLIQSLEAIIDPIAISSRCSKQTCRPTD